MKPLQKLALLLTPILLAAPAVLGQTLAKGPISTGGGILARQKGGKPKTLADAGFVFKQVEEKVLNPQYQEYYPVSKETKAALRQILSELPVGLNVESLAAWIGGGSDRSLFIRQSKVDAKDYEQIKSIYSSVIRSFGQKLDPSIFMLIAYSKGNQTFILPDFDDKNVTDEQRALNLIHEWNMRGARENQSTEEAQKRLQRALMIDYAIHQYRKSAKTNADVLEFFAQMKKLETPFFQEHLYHRALNTNVAQLIAQVEAKVGRPLLLSEFFLMQYGYIGLSDEAMDKNLVHHFDSLVPGTAERLGNLRFYQDAVSDFAENFVFDGNRRKIAPYVESTYGDYLNKKFKEAVPFVQRAETIMAEQCAQNENLLKASEIKEDGLLHYDEVMGRVLVLNCLVSNPYAQLLWATSHIIPPKEW